MSETWVRSPSLPPIDDPPKDGEDDHRWDWYHESPGGGTVMPFGKHKGRRLNQLGWTYLNWARENVSHVRSCFILQEVYGVDNKFQQKQVSQALDVYFEGLYAMAEEDYGIFLVPFGKHKGQKIYQCRDKRWLVWALRQPKLVEKVRTIHF